jgi:hypothetical protein
VSIDTITWDDIDRANQAAASYETATCPQYSRCLGRAEGMIRRLPERVLVRSEGIHRHLDDATRSSPEADGRSPLTSCSGATAPTNRKGRPSMRASALRNGHLPNTVNLQLGS